MDKLKNKWALVTGASSGLGVDFARVLAEAGCHLVLVARRLPQLQSLQQELQKQYSVKVEVISMDLGTSSAPQELFEQVKTKGLEIDVLINNAGFGLYGDFLKIPWEKERAMLELDILTLVHLTKLFLPGMVSRNFGYVLQIASIGAYQPCPSYASYGAAKSFVLNFSEAINYELRRTNVRVCTLSPGVTATEFFQVAGQTTNTFQRLTMMKSRTVAEIGIRSMLCGTPSKVSGWINALSIFSLRFIPRRLMTAVAGFLMKDTL